MVLVKQATGNSFGGGGPPIIQGVGVTSISPTSGVSVGGTAVTITGTNFSGSPTVTIGGTTATSIVVVNTTTITCTTPAGTVGTADVVVAGNGGGNQLFTYTFSGTFFTDSFASGDFTHSDNSMVWGASIVNVAVVSNFGRTDSYSARFNFDSVGSVGWAELRFTYNKTYPAVWSRFYIYYPDGTEGLGPRVASTATGTKFMRHYSLPESQYPRHGASTYTTTPTGDKTLGPQAGLFPGTGTVSEIGSRIAPWLTDANRGRWIKVEFYDLAATIANNDGAQQIWIDDVLVSDVSGIPDYEAPGQGFDGGYLQGADNIMTNAGTFVYIDDVAFSTTGRA